MATVLTDSLMMAEKGRENQLQREAEILRLALPLMSQHKVPTTPENYCIWYHYVAGDKPNMNAQIDQLLEEKKAFTPELNKQLYQQFFSPIELDRLEQVRQELQSTLSEAATSLGATSADAGRFSQVLEKLSKCDNATRLSDEFFQLATVVFEETRQIKASFEKMKEDFDTRTQEMDELRKELETVRRKASTDALTGLANSTTFYEILEEETARAADTQDRLCLIMIDIDHFKQVNDSHGHLVGDKVIRFVAKILMDLIKGKDTAARYGGEEFAIILPDTPLEGAVSLAENIRNKIKTSKLVRSGSREPLGMITVSVGIAKFWQNEQTRSLVDRADKALYQSKNSGRDQVTTDNR